MPNVVVIIMHRFTSDCNGLLVASDVAARGLDIPKVEHVIHYQTPKNSEVSGEEIPAEEREGGSEGEREGGTEREERDDCFVSVSVTVRPILSRNKNTFWSPNDNINVQFIMGDTFQSVQIVLYMYMQ